MHCCLCVYRYKELDQTAKSPKLKLSSEKASDFRSFTVNFNNNISNDKVLIHSADVYISSCKCHNFCIQNQLFKSWAHKMIRSYCVYCNSFTHLAFQQRRVEGSLEGHCDSKCMDEQQDCDNVVHPHSAISYCRCSAETEEWHPDTCSLSSDHHLPQCTHG